MYETSTLLLLLLKTFENVKAQNIIDFIKETLFFISKFNIFILMFVFYFLF